MNTAIPITSTGGNVHSQLVPNSLTPELGWKRFDMAGFRGNCKDVEKFFAPQPICWLCSTTDDILKLVDHGIVHAVVEGPNEPNLAFPADPKWSNPGRPAYSADDYVTVLRGMYELCNRHDYSLLGIGSSDWLSGYTWTKAVVSRGALNYCHGVATHFYGAQTQADVMLIATKYALLLDDRRLARKPHICTEFGSTDPRSLASVTKGCAAHGIPIALYDLCDTGDLALLKLPDGSNDYTKATPSKLLTGFRAEMNPAETN